MSDPQVSVIIPVYNSMPYLTETLTSVLGQDLGSFEVIAVNDGSTDGSAEELDRFAALHPRLTVHHQPNSGWPGSPRNRGLDRARGEFVFFMDADDTMAPVALSRMVELAEQSKTPVDVVVPRMMGTGGRVVQSVFRTQPHGRMRLERAMETLSPQKLFRRELIECHGLRFPEEKVRLEDGIFVTQAYLLARGIAYAGRDPLYFIARRDDGMNISSEAIDPESYVGSCRRIAELLLAGVAKRERANRLVLQFFLRKGLRFYVPKRWLLIAPAQHAEWVALHRAFLADLVSPSFDKNVSDPAARYLLRLIRAGDVSGIDAQVAAVPACAHTTQAVRVSENEHGIELEVLVRPEGEGSLLRAHAPGRERIRAMSWVSRSCPPLSPSRGTRRLGRRLVRRIAGRMPSFTLVLGGRRDGKQRAVRGVVAGYDQAAGLFRVRFAVPDETLRALGRQRVDVWTVAQAASGFSARQRVEAAPRGAAQTGAASVYATSGGNLSLTLSSRNRPAKAAP